MTWGHKNQSDHVVRIHVLDRSGVPYRPPIAGWGAQNWNNTVEPGEAEFNMDPDFPRTLRTDKFRMHITTYAPDSALFTGDPNTPGPHRQGMGLYSVEVFTPGPSERWLYCLYPRVMGQLIRLRTSNNKRHRVSVFGQSQPNPSLGELVPGLRPPAGATWMTNATFYDVHAWAPRLPASVPA